MGTVAQALREAGAALAGDDARREAELLLCQALGCTRGWLFAYADDPLPTVAAQRFRALVERRQRGEPVAQIVGSRWFWSLELAVTADTLIPRPETETLVELALARLPEHDDARVLDLGTGTGAIALAIASDRPGVRVTAVDASTGALAVAVMNASRLGLPRVRFLLSDWFAGLAGERFEMIVSNPPYIADDDPHLAIGDLRFEPRSALASGSDGLDAIRKIVAQAPAHLEPGGWLIVEHGWTQGEAVRALFKQAGFESVKSDFDLEDRERVTLGRRA
ncbi:peptide chain release factor N(5)-glutamine methyltransferase [Arenimonas oryziterrae]|uniref:Release factor glutamine methyltransferase n=1 Tax=Arenimonas oryziterrae DSM 21050 = YC6267 TaxID=1121015 RepID=A0A091BG62_9GAMM|nr:peptide chain release factor N(5)-glutamine methyltransferase [Arenimonas oryziterrae]KFN43355.1 hypothetical protein N789_08760 [Arenimonas oryziterrae DSM 21050 = YC6267]